LSNHPHVDLSQSKQTSPLRKRADFLRLRSGRRFSGKFFTVQALKAGAGQSVSRVGYTVTKRIGNAVVRNRIKRRLREVSGQVLRDHKGANMDIVVIAKRSALSAEFAALGHEFSTALDHIHRNGAKGSQQQTAKRR
jgi:ribonuclease P protein component